MFEQLLPFLTGGLGTPGINPGAGQPPPVAAAPPAAAAQQPGFLQRLQGALFTPGQGTDPALAQQQQQQAMLKLGLGMLAAGSKGQGLGEGIFNSYSMASKDFEGAMDKAYTNAERKRMEEKQDKQRAEDLDWRKTEFGAQIADRRAAEQRQAEADARRDETTRRGQDIQRTLGGMRNADDGARGRKAEIEARILEQRYNRMNELNQKRAAGQPLTASEQQELTALTTGARLGYEPTNPYAFLEGMGGLGMGGGGGGNPLLNDPDL